MQSYVVRIYRRARSPAEQVVGLVERIEAGDQVAFHGFEELVRILAEDDRCASGVLWLAEPPRRSGRPIREIPLTGLPATGPSIVPIVP